MSNYLLDHSPGGSVILNKALQLCYIIIHSYIDNYVSLQCYIICRLY